LDISPDTIKMIGIMIGATGFLAVAFYYCVEFMEKFSLKIVND